MAELTIRPEEIRAALDSFVKSYEPSGAVAEEVGRVTLAGDGIAQVEGLPGAMANELLRFEDGTLGLALSLDVREIGVVVLGEFSGIEEGQEVRRTGEVLSVPVGDGYLGRVVDPLGQPIDGLGDIETSARRALELQAPGVMARKSVHEPLQTGIKAIDSMIPIGRGQRQLIIGDRQTGKTAIAIDTIINQKANWETGDPTKQVRCIYVAVGQKGSTIAAVRGALEEAGALEVHDDRRGARVRPGGLQVPRALHRLGHRPALDVRRQARPHRVRRPVEAGRGLPCRVAAPASPAGPRGVPR
ncbi:ATP synthase subunit alpha [Cellulomonas persica]